MAVAGGGHIAGQNFPGNGPKTFLIRGGPSLEMAGTTFVSEASLGTGLGEVEGDPIGKPAGRARRRMLDSHGSLIAHGFWPKEVRLIRRHSSVLVHMHGEPIGRFREFLMDDISPGELRKMPLPNRDGWR
jgi:hypothetical protein